MAGACRAAFRMVLAVTIMLVVAACVRYHPAPETAGPQSSSPTSPQASPGATSATPSATPKRGNSATRSPTSSALTTPRATATRRPPASYGFSLPGGPTNAANKEDVVYESLRTNDCGTAQRDLDSYWRGMSSPPFVLIFQAAVEACKDHRTTARQWYDQLTRKFPDTYNHCSNMWTVQNVYRALVSYLKNMPTSSVPVGDYPITFWPLLPNGEDDYDHDPRRDDFPTASPSPEGSP